MTEFTKQSVINFLHEIRKQELKLRAESEWLSMHNYKVESMLMFEKSEVLRRLGNQYQNHFDLGWVNYPDSPEVTKHQEG